MRLCCCRRLGISALSYLQEVKEKGPKDEGVKMGEVSSEFRNIEMRKGIPALSFLYSYFTKEL